MGRQIRIKAVPRQERDVQLYVQALIALARQLQEQDQQRELETGATARPDKDPGANRG